jgi:hypothetical protein
MQSGMSASAKSMMMSSKLLTTTEQDALASRTGPRRTVYYTKQLSNEAGGQYARTHQYLGEWKSNKCGRVRSEPRVAQAPGMVG